MSETKKRKVHLPEFKAKVGLQALRGVKTINEIAQDYRVHPVQVSQWKKEIQEQAKSLFEGKRGPAPVALLHKSPGHERTALLIGYGFCPEHAKRQPPAQSAQGGLPSQELA